MIEILGIFGKIAFFGFFGPISNIITFLSIYLITWPRYIFSIQLEKLIRRKGFKPNILDIHSYSFYI